MGIASALASAASQPIRVGDLLHGDLAALPSGTVPPTAPSTSTAAVAVDLALADLINAGPVNSISSETGLDNDRELSP